MAAPRRSVRVTDDIWNRLKDIALTMNDGRDQIADAEATPSMVIHLAIRDYLKRREVSRSETA